MKIIEKIGNKNQYEYVSIKTSHYNWFFESVIKKAKIEENNVN
jgi:hypothetical protein